MEDAIKNGEMLSTVKWYFELKNLSLRKAMTFRCPLSVEGHRDLRLYYSQYFAGLLSATELLLEKEYPRAKEFKKTLHEKLIFEGYPDGETNYSYLRELRNSIIHRGADVTSAAHVVQDIPMMISPSPITNRSGAISLTSFGYYLIEVIAKCESVIADIFLAHINEFKLFDIRLSQDEFVEHTRKQIENSSIVPEWVKEASRATVTDIDFDKIHQASIQSLLDVLKTDVFAEHGLEVVELLQHLSSANHHE